MRNPIGGVTEVTSRCHWRCMFCSNSLPMDDLDAGFDELTYGKHCQILDENAGNALEGKGPRSSHKFTVNPNPVRGRT